MPKKEYYEKNKEKVLQQQREYRKTQKGKNISNEYYKTEKGRKRRVINQWKSRGVIFSDYDLLYDIYINTTNCDSCKVELTRDKVNTNTTRCLDHDHTITDCENVRNILCHSCNRKVN